MKKARFRIGGMTVCVLLALLTGAPVAMVAATSALAQQTTNVGQQVATAIGSGQSTGAITQIIQQAGGANAANTQQITQIVQGLQSGQASPTAIAGLVNGLVGGQLPPAAAAALAVVPNLGNMTPAQLGQLLNNPTVQSALGQLGPLAQQVAGVQNLLNIAQNPAALLNPQVAGQVAQQIATAFPSIAQALGGVQGITAALGAVGGLIGALSGGSGGLGGAGTTQQPLSNQNPVNNSFTDAGCNCSVCNVQIPAHYGEVRSHAQAEFQRHRNWMVNNYWLENILPALQLMAEQLTAVGIQQMQMVGAMLDAKHQMETQRLFQQMMAEAHKDYQPSEGMCTFGTNVRSLAGSERRSNLAQTAFASRMTQRQAASGDVTSREGLDSDKRSRLQHFLANYCDQADNANGLGTLCQTAVPQPGRRNIDVDFTRNIESRLTLDVDFMNAEETDDEQDVFALAANLFANNVAPIIAPGDYAAQDGRIRLGNVEKYMDMRSVFAKRSVAQNSFAAITSLRAEGAPDSAPYLKAVMRELGITDVNEINQLVGENPSYFAQMEVLTKKLYQNPTFYTELYDKPVNVERKGAAMQAIGLMQDRDLYNSLLRSEVVLSVLLETMLQKEQDKVVNEGPKRNPAGGTR